MAPAAAGASVVVNYSSDELSAEKVVKAIGSKNAVAVRADVSTTAGIESLVQKTLGRFHKIDILIANAGVLPMKDLEHMTEEDFDQTFSLKVKGPYFLCQVGRHPSRLLPCWQGKI